MDITSILENLGGIFGGFCGGGALTFLATWKFARKEAEATAMQKVQGIYQSLTEDLVKEIERLKEEVELLRHEVGTLSHRAGLACFRPFCISRIFENTEPSYQLESNEDNQTEHPAGI